MMNLYNIYVKKYNIEIKYEDNQSFFKLGIKDDFECFLTFKKRNYTLYLNILIYILFL